MIAKIVVAPTEEPLTLAEAKLHLRVTSTNEDALITSLIQAARERCEDVTMRSLVTRTVDAYLDAWPESGVVNLPYPPVASIVSVKYTDSTGTQNTMNALDYYLAQGYGRLALGYGKTWPVAELQPVEAIVVRYTAGYGAASAVPAWVKHAMRLLIAHWYIHREEVTMGTVGHTMPEAALTLLRANRAY